MNYRFNAQLHRLPPCPECNAFESSPCRDNSGNIRAPHRVRERVAAGDLFVVSVHQARAARVLRALRKLVAAVREHEP